MDLYGIVLVLLVYFESSSQQLVGQKRLNDYVAHYEGLTYSTDEVHTHHMRAKRSTKQNPYVHIKFNAHGRYFHLRLRRDTTTFSQDFKYQHSDGSLSDHDTSFVYEGDLWGEPNTQVYGSIIKGVFAGTIITPKATYHVEKAEHYFRGEEKNFHSVIYSEDHIDLTPMENKGEEEEENNNTIDRKKRSTRELGGCGSANSDVNKWMQNVQSSAVHEPEIEKRSLYEARPSYENIYSSNYNKQKQKRATTENKRTCTLYLQSDIMLWDYMTNSDAKKGLGYTDDQAREEITSLFALHVKGVKNIYHDTLFESKQDGLRYSGFSFVVRRVKINETKDCLGKGATTNRFCEKNIDVSYFLNLNSLQNHNDFCLAYVFTYRDFAKGTLGLAWVGSPTRASGGICEKNKQFNENNEKVYKSLNTGIVTLLNYGNRVLPKVSTLTFAHELGHNFGSPHDSGGQCAPQTSRNGNFIMFASATNGDKVNNNKFSPCSLANITQVLHAVLTNDQGKQNCFVESEEAFCGNKIVEDTEQCDCGYEEDCANQQCCYPREAGENKMCTLKETASCSPTAGPCCTNSCQLVAESEKDLCRKADSCTLDSYCNGTSALCPAPEPVQNLTACNDFTQVCISGECQLSICRKIGWGQCLLTTPEENDKNFDKGTLCFVACENPMTSECVSTGDAKALEKEGNEPLKTFLKTNSRDDGIKLPPGAACDNYQGYCDVFQKCRGVDADGPLARLKNLIFNEETFNSIRSWIIQHWWAVLLMGILLIIVMGAFIACCAVHTPSSNPKRAPPRKINLKPHSRQRQQSPYSQPVSSHQLSVMMGPSPGNSAGPNRGGPPHGKGRGPSSQAAPPSQYEMKHKGPHQPRI